MTICPPEKQTVHPLQNLLAHRQERGRARGIYAVCSAHPWVLRAAMRQALADGSPLLIEATCNQVNQFGGYTGMRPADFRELVKRIAQEEGLTIDRLILGGDHLGPNPWQSRPADEAMEMAMEMVREYVAAGFTKIHLDASMPCAGDPAVLSDEVIAERAALLCAAAEQAALEQPPVYVIGTEVPTPGGATEALDHLAVTKRAAAEKTLAVHRQVFAAHGLDAASGRVVAVVVQPGVEFNHDSVVSYQPERAQPLTAMLEQERGLVFEAHSSDYQPAGAYRDLVRDGFAILKVGPALTFAMREALFALAAVEAQLVERQRSQLIEALDALMMREPADWIKHYPGDARQQKLLRRYSYSDRIRYYWGQPAAQEAVETLLRNLRNIAIPETLLSAFLPVQYRAMREGVTLRDPEEIVIHQIREALIPYARACFHDLD